MAIKVYRDGRTKMTGADYAKAKKAKWEAQDKTCALCGLYLPLAMADADHIIPRGLGGGKRDDRTDNLRIVHRHCHFTRHWKERDCAAHTETATRGN